MIRFWVKGIFRDKNRSLFPVIIVTMGVMLTVIIECWVSGILEDLIDHNARFSTGHLKVTTRSYAENESQIPNDLAIIERAKILKDLAKQFPDLSWIYRIRFSGLLDIPGEDGETLKQMPTVGIGVDLLSKDSKEIKRLNIKSGLASGSLPDKTGQFLMSHHMAEQLEIKPGDPVTLVTATMHGALSMHNLTLSGTVDFGVAAMDNSAIIIDISDGEFALDMGDAASEILGFYNVKAFQEIRSDEIKTQFNMPYEKEKDPFSPFMRSLYDQNDLFQTIQYARAMMGFGTFIFLFAMSVVLWNSGLLGGIRRYAEFGLRLAMGESHKRIYYSMVTEYGVIGIAGSMIGTLFGLAISYILEIKGVDTSAVLQNTSMMMPVIMRAHITAKAFYIGFIPGVLSTVLGALMSGIGIFKRDTATLFKELEV